MGYYILGVVIFFIIHVAHIVGEVKEERLHQAREKLICRGGYIPRTVHYFSKDNLTRGGAGAAYLNMLLGHAKKFGYL